MRSSEGGVYVNYQGRGSRIMREGIDLKNMYNLVLGGVFALVSVWCCGGYALG